MDSTLWTLLIVAGLGFAVIGGLARLCDTLELNLCKGDGSEESWSYPLSAAEQEVLLRKMGVFCQQQTGMSLHDYTQQLRDSESQTPEMQM